MNRRIVRTGGVALIVTALAGLAPSAHAGSIFDDNWVPPQRTEPATRPAPPGTPITAVTPAPSIPPIPTPPPEVTSPAPAATPVPRPRPPATPALVRDQPRNYRPTPSKAELSTSRKLLREVFAKQLEDKTTRGRRALAAQLLDEAHKASETPPDNYALLSAAYEAAKEGQDLDLCLRATNNLTDLYGADMIAFRVDAALAIGFKGDGPAAVAANQSEGFRLIAELIAFEEFTAAARVCRAMQAGAGADPVYRARVQQRTKDVDTARAERERVRAMIETLRTAPDDPAANQAVGSYLALTQGLWDRGMPMIAKGSDRALAALAARSIASSTQAAARADIADEWWALADRSPEPRRSRIKAYAGQWYYSALTDLPAGLRRTSAEARANEARLTEIAISPYSAEVRVVYAFNDPAVLDDFNVGSGTAKINKAGELEMRGDQVHLMTKIRYAAPMKAEFEVYCQPGGTLDIFPRILTDRPNGGLELSYGTSYNKQTEFSVFGARATLPHDPIRPNNVYRVTLSVDRLRVARIEIDGKVLVERQLAADARPSGHVVLGAGRGRVVYRRCVITAQRM